MIYSCIVTIVRITSYGDGYLLARPATGRAGEIVTSKSIHDIRIIVFRTMPAIVLLVEFEEKVVFLKEVGHTLVE
jgi:hypothetical protein